MFAQPSRLVPEAVKPSNAVGKSPSLRRVGVGRRCYNKDRQLTQVTRPDGQTMVMGYDTAGRLSTVTTPSGVTTYTYSPTTGNIISVVAPSGVTLSYTHDGSLPLSTTWSGGVTGSVSRTYNADIRVSSVSVNGASVASLTYDNDGLLTGAGSLVISRSSSTGFENGTTLGSVATARTYSTFGELATTSADYGTTSLYTTSYTRDALGRIIQLDETIEGVSSTYQYEYDLAGRLKKVSEAGQPVAEYSYDDNGNRTSMTGPLGLTLSATYDAQDRLTAYGSTMYTYTKNGELETRTDSSGTTSFSYDVQGNLLSVSLPGGTTVEYVIDGENRRVARKESGTVTHKWLFEDQLRVTAELDATDAVVSRFVYGTRVNVPEHMEKGGKTYRILTDHLGSVRLVVDTATGTVAQRLDYDEYGQVLLDTSPGFQPFGFAGGLYDPQTKLVRFGARDYEAEVGRWTSKDPVGV